VAVTAAPPGPAVRTLRFADLDAATAYAVWRLRQDVFVVEQACAYPDLDGRDPEPRTRHVLLEDDGALLGYARVLAEDDHDRVGRVLLVPGARGHHLADPLLEAALEACDAREVRLDAQAPLAGWYARFGFTVTGPEFLEDGIPHVPMRRAGPGSGPAGKRTAGDPEHAPGATGVDPASRWVPRTDERAGVSRGRRRRAHDGPGTRSAVRTDRTHSRPMGGQHGHRQPRSTSSRGRSTRIHA